MKPFFFLLNLLPFLSNAQESCGDRFAPVFNLSAGYSNDVAFGMEAGLWPANARIGATTGLLLHSRDYINEKRSADKTVIIDVCGRLIYKLSQPSCQTPQALTAFGTTSGLIGFSYRFYISLGDDLLGIEPNYTNKNGTGINLLFTFHL